MFRSAVATALIFAKLNAEGTKRAARYAALRPYGFMIAMGLAMLGVLTLASAPVVVALWLVIQL